jgi:hypothetical protein
MLNQMKYLFYHIYPMHQECARAGLWVNLDFGRVYASVKARTGILIKLN